MKHWRMAMRAGTHGKSMWPDCFKNGVAAITYKSVSEVDFSQVAEEKFADVCKDLKPSQRTSLRRVVYELKGGDAIYVKEGPSIIAKGIIRGPKRRAYKFDSARIVDENDIPWSHQVPVAWEPPFPEIRITVGRAQQFVVEELSAEDVARFLAKLEVVSDARNLYTARLCWNTRNWVQPSGDARMVEQKNTYTARNGFGHEEWLFNFQWILDGWKYGFLQASELVARPDEAVGDEATPFLAEAPEHPSLMILLHPLGRSTTRSDAR